MTIHETHEGDKLVLALEGRLDTTTAPRLQDALLKALDESTQVELDFAKLNYVSSAGLRVLLMGQKKSMGQGGNMIISHASEDVLEVFELTGFISILTVV